MGSQNQSCGTLPCSGSTSNTSVVTSVGGYTIKYGGTSGPNDYSIVSTRFNNDLLSTCSSWVANLAYYASTYRGTGLSWIGHIGTEAHNRCSWHQHCKAWDLNHIRFSNGTYLDFVRPSESWNSSSRAERRLYWAIDASLQRYFNATIDAPSDPTDHDNHIHVDKSCGSVAAPYHPWLSYSDDTKFIQYLCNDFNSAGIDTDGYWGNDTQAAWTSLLSALDMSCINPLTSAASWKTFLGYIMRHGLANRSAGYWDYICSEVQ